MLRTTIKKGNQLLRKKERVPARENPVHSLVPLSSLSRMISYRSKNGERNGGLRKKYDLPSGAVTLGVIRLKRR